MKSTRNRLRRCDGILRRDVLHVGALTALGLNLSDWIDLRDASAAEQPAVRAEACILIWLDGGPSHLETFDLKPDAPTEVRGPFQPISTSVPGIQLSEYLSRTAHVMDHLAVIRSMTSPLGEHNFASHYLLTGYRPTPALDYPGLPSVLTHIRKQSGALPANIALQRPNAMIGPGYLDDSTAPFVVVGDPSQPDFKVKDLSPSRGLSLDRLMRRRSMRDAVDALARHTESTLEAESISEATLRLPVQRDPSFERAYRLIASPEARQAFDLKQEPADVRNRYGRHQLGQNCLMARRLVEAGTRFVTVTDRGWDTHENLYTRLKEGFTGGSVGKIPRLDVAYAALIEDRYARFDIGHLDGRVWSNPKAEHAWRPRPLAPCFQRGPGRRRNPGRTGHRSIRSPRRKPRRTSGHAR